MRACAAGNPDPTALAQRLFARATADEWGVVADYADVLRPAGVGTLRGLITEELQRLPRLVAEFADYVRGLRAAHRRKRNVIAALDAARLPA